MQGGSGNFQWITSNTSVATVNKKGLVATKNIVGKTEVKVSDYKNPSFSDAGSITVLPPEELNFVSSDFEVETGREIVLPISVFAFLDEGEKEDIILSSFLNLIYFLNYLFYPYYGKKLPAIASGCLNKNNNFYLILIFPEFIQLNSVEIYSVSV